MIISRRHLAGSIGATLVATSLASRAASAQTAGPPFKAGAVLSKTGPYSQIGAFLEPALITGVKQVNALGGILGRPVELIVRDDASNAGRAVLAAKELLSEQKVDFMFPEFVSPLVLAILPTTTESKTVTFTTGSAPQISDVSKYPYSFQYADNSAIRIPPFIAALKKFNGHRVGILVSTNTSTLAIGELLAAELPKHGMVVAQQRQFSVDAKDLTAQLQSLRDAGADIVAFDGPARDNNRVVMLGMQTIGWKAKVITEHSALFGDLTSQFPPSTHDQFFAFTYRVAVNTGTQSPVMKDFIDLFKQIAPIESVTISAAARDLVFLAKWAFDTAKKDHGSTDADTVRRTLEGIGQMSFPQDYFLTVGNPAYTADRHSATGADFSKVWGLARVSKPVDGVYAGENLDL